MEVSDAIVTAYMNADVSQCKGSMREAVRAGLEAAFAAACREIAHEALKPETLRRSVDLIARARPFMRPCGPCDYGLPEYACQCSDQDYRGIVVDLVAEVEKLRKQLHIEENEAAAAETYAQLENEEVF